MTARRARGHAGDPDAHPGGRLQVHLVKPRAAHRLRTGLGLVSAVGSKNRFSTPHPSAACPSLCSLLPLHCARGESEQAPAQSNGTQQRTRKRTPPSARRCRTASLATSLTNRHAAGASRLDSQRACSDMTASLGHRQSSGHTCLRHSRPPAVQCLGRGQPARTYVRT